MSKERIAELMRQIDQAKAEESWAPHYADSPSPSVAELEAELASLLGDR